MSFRSSKIFFSSRISVVSSFIKDGNKIRIINWYWYATNGWKGIIRGICHVIHQYEKANGKYIKDYDKSKE